MGQYGIVSVTVCNMTEAWVKAWGNLCYFHNITMLHKCLNRFTRKFSAMLAAPGEITASKKNAKLM